MVKRMTRAQSNADPELCSIELGEVIDQSAGRPADFQRTAPKRVETQAEALARLAAIGRQNGLRVLIESESEEHFVTSSTMPNVIYRVTRETCSCQGHKYAGRCQHRGFYLEWLKSPDRNPDPEPPETTSIELVCEVCGGDGYDGNVPCRACRGRGKADISVAVIDLPHFDAWEMEPNALRGAQCSTCQGDGFKLVSTGSHLSDWNAEPCARCQGAGLVPVPAPEWSLIAA